MSSAPAQVQQIRWYPQSHATARPIREELAAVAQNKDRCSSIYLDTVEGMSDDFPYTEGADHHQGLARSHKLADGSVYFFLTHSETDDGDQGSLSSYRFGGPTGQARQRRRGSMVSVRIPQRPRRRPARYGLRRRVRREVPSLRDHPAAVQRPHNLQAWRHRFREHRNTSC